jgi:molecular chaperone GrpE
MKQNDKKKENKAQEAARKAEAAQARAEEAASKVEEEPVPADDPGLEDLKAKLAAKEKDLADLSDKYIRLMAEYDNYRRRSQKDKEAMYGNNIADVVREWLPVIDNLERAELAVDQYESEEVRQIAEGIALLRKQVQQVLEKLGVELIDCCDKPFDPNLHNAVLHIEDEDYGPSTVVAELRKGYVRKDQVIRHSDVQVAN